MNLLGITNNFLFPSVTVNCMGNNLNIVKPRYSEQILSVPWQWLKQHSQKCQILKDFTSVNIIMTALNVFFIELTSLSPHFFNTMVTVLQKYL